MLKYKMEYKLGFWGDTSIPHKQWHATLESATEEAHRVLYLMDNRAAHPAIITSKDGGEWAVM